MITSVKMQRNKGFTLLELMVSMALFAFVAVGALTAMFAVLEANQRTQASVRAMDGLSFTLESMTRELRVGREYNCSLVPSPPNTDDCSSGTHIGFTTSEGGYMEYRLNGTTIERSTDSTNWVPMTGSNIVVDNFELHVLGSFPHPVDSEQPRVVMLIEGTAGAESGTPRSFSIQTTITQRFPDF